MHNTITEVNIHPTAVIEEGAVLEEGVEIGAYAYIGGKVRLGRGTKVHHHGTVEGCTVMGEDNEVFPYAFIGGKTHDKKYLGGEPRLVIGSGNTFREYMTVHLATADGDATVVGSNNLFLAYSHIAHDCIVGDNIIISAHSALGGHVHVEDNANIGWSVGIHQFCRVGRFAMIGFLAKVNQDVPPFMLVDGNPAEVKTYNKVGLERAGFSQVDLKEIKRIYSIIYREGMNRSQALGKIAEIASSISRGFIEFSEKSNRGWL